MKLLDQWKLKRRFYKLKKQWYSDVAGYSSTTCMIKHSSYQEIIAMGPKAVPLIMNDLQKNGPNFWFYALRLLTNIDPVITGHQGYILKITDDWLNWWKYAERDFRKKHNL